MKRWAWWLRVCVAAACGAMVCGAEEGGGAYTARIRQQVVVYGEVAGAMETVVAVRADGARARVVRPVKEGVGSEMMERSVELPDGFVGTYYPAAKVQATGYRTRAMLEAMEKTKLTGKSECTATKDLAVKSLRVAGEERMLGVRVVRVVADTERVRGTHWMAPELGCLAVKREMKYLGAGGAVEQVMEETALELRLGEPEKGLFERPEGYEEVEPSEADLRMAKALGRACPECEKARGGNKDQLYRSLQRARQF